MATDHAEHGGAHRQHTHVPGEETAPGADAFVEIHEPDVPGDPEHPIIREDEHYERLSEPETFPSERVPPGPGGTILPRP